MKKTILFTLLMVLISFSFLSFTDAFQRFNGVTIVPHIKEVRMISVLGSLSGDAMTDIRIQPYKKIYLDRFTRVNWSNLSDAPIRIKFGAGNKCTDISKFFQRTEHWRLNKNCYITEEPIPHEGRLQILFNEQGIYDYEIQFVGTKSSEKGKLIVF